MKKFFAEKQGDSFIFVGDELLHFNVLRCALFEQVLCLGNGDADYLCEVTEITKKQAKAKIVEEIPNTKNPQKNICVFQGLVKGEKQDLIVQKLTELGISKLVFFESEFAIAKGNVGKIERLKKISQEACKQCGRNIPLEISNPVKFNDMLSALKEYDIIIFANEKQTARHFDEHELKNKHNVAIIVGSEGGFSNDEITRVYDAGACSFGLGARILRAETATIALSAIISHITNN